VVVTRIIPAQNTAGPTAPGPSSLPLTIRSTFSGVLANTAHTSSARLTGRPTATAQTGSPLAAEIESCRLANLRQQTALSAAAASLEQFQKHIDAMNLLVAGKITLSVAMTFWDQTRVEADQKVAAFRSADQALTSGGATCPELGIGAACSAPLAEVNAISACAAAVGARTTALARSRTAVATWEHHIHDMEMLRLGQITPAQATAAWQRNWKLGQQQVGSYAAAVKVADAKHCPLG
jgi:hypothetical protein